MESLEESFGESVHSPSECESIEHIESDSLDSDIIPRKKRCVCILSESDTEIDEDEKSDSELEIM